MNQTPDPAGPKVSEEELMLIQRWQEEIRNLSSTEGRQFIERKLGELGPGAQRLARAILYVEPMSSEKALGRMREWQEQFRSVAAEQRKEFIEEKLAELGDEDAQRLARAILMNLLGSPKKPPADGRTPAPKPDDRGSPQGR